jgi:hypothetical protein
MCHLIRQVHIKNGTTIDAVIKKQEKFCGQQMTDFVHSVQQNSRV